MKKYTFLLLSLFSLSLKAMEVESPELSESTKIDNYARAGFDKAYEINQKTMTDSIIDSFSKRMQDVEPNETSKEKGRRTCIELLNNLLSRVDIDNQTRIERAHTIISEYTGGDNKLFNDFKSKISNDTYSFKVDPQDMATAAAAYKYIDNNLKGKRSPGSSRNSMRESQSGFQRGFDEKQEGFGRGSVAQAIERPIVSISEQESLPYVGEWFASIYKNQVLRDGLEVATKEYMNMVRYNVLEDLGKKDNVNYFHIDNPVWGLSSRDKTKEELHAIEEVNKAQKIALEEWNKNDWDNKIKRDSYARSSAEKALKTFNKMNGTNFSSGEDIYDESNEHNEIAIKARTVSVNAYIAANEYWDNKIKKNKKYGSVSMPTMPTEKKS